MKKQRCPFTLFIAIFLGLFSWNNLRANVTGERLLSFWKAAKANVARKSLSDMKIPFTRQAFRSAIRSGDWVTVELFLDCGENPDLIFRDANGAPLSTPLLEALKNDNSQTALTLLARGASPNLAPRGITPLKMARVTSPGSAALNALKTRGALIALPERFNGKRYLVVYDIVTWTLAEQRAKALGGRLVEIANQDENVFIQNLTCGNCFWIGAKRLPNQRAWTWESGAAMNAPADRILTGLWPNATDKTEQTSRLAITPSGNWAETRNSPGSPENALFVTGYVVEFPPTSNTPAGSPQAKTSRK